MNSDDRDLERIAGRSLKDFYLPSKRMESDGMHYSSRTRLYAGKAVNLGTSTGAYTHVIEFRNGILGVKFYLLSVYDENGQVFVDEGTGYTGYALFKDGKEHYEKISNFMSDVEVVVRTSRSYDETYDLAVEMFRERLESVSETVGRVVPSQELTQESEQNQGEEPGSGNSDLEAVAMSTIDPAYRIFRALDTGKDVEEVFTSDYGDGQYMELSVGIRKFSGDKRWVNVRWVCRSTSHGGYAPGNIKGGGYFATDKWRDDGFREAVTKLIHAVVRGNNRHAEVTHQGLSKHWFEVTKYFYEPSYSHLQGRARSKALNDVHKGLSAHFGR